MLEPLGDQIRIDDVRELRRDLHMRPFEADRRVYLVFGADTMNEDAADALLKDLEEPPPYAVIVLVAEDLGPLPDTIRSRCQLVPFRRLSEKAVRDAIRERAPELADTEVTTLARVAGGRLDRADRLLDPAAAERRGAVIGVARSVYGDPGFEPADAAAAVLAGIAERGDEAKAKAEDSRSPCSSCRRARPTSASGAPSAAPSATSSSRCSRSSSGGTATSSCSPSAPRRRSCTSTGSRTCAPTPRASACSGRAGLRARARRVARSGGAAGLDAARARGAAVRLHRELGGAVTAA